MRWDIVEEHLESAAFLWSQRAARLRSPRALLADLHGLEARLFAHLEGLRRAGPAASERLLEPALAGDDAEQAAAATLALASGPADAAVQKALAAAGAAPPEVAAAIFEALKVAPGDGMDGALLAALRTTPRALHGLMLAALAARRVHPGPMESLVAGPFLRSAPAAVLSYATRVALDVPQEAVTQALRSPSVAERDAGLELGMMLGMPEAFSRCAEVIAGGEEAPGHPLLLWALAAPDGAEPLRRATGNPATAAAALWAAGFSRDPDLVEPCLELARDPALARLAGEAFSALTGQAIEGPLVAPRPEDGEGEEPVPDDSPEEELPVPDPQAMETRWRERQKKRAAARPAVALAERLEELEVAPLRRRHALALGLRLSSGGRWQLGSTALRGVQSAELEALAREAASGRAPAEARRRGMIEPLPVPRRPAPKATAPDRPAGAALRVLAAAMVSAIGDTAEEGAAAAMAGVRRSAEMDGTMTAGSVEALEDTGEALAVGHQVPSAVGFEDRGRLLQLGSSALADLEPVLRTDPHRRTALFVALPSDYYFEQQFEELGEELPPREPGEKILEEMLKLVDLGPMAAVRAYQETAVDFARALADALDGLKRREFDRCVVGAIDSLVDPAVVEALDDLLLLKNEELPARMMPGEAAAFLVVDLEGRGKEGTEALAWLSGFHSATGPGHRKSGVPPNGKLLASCIKETLAGAVRPSVLASHLNGDDRRAMDWGNAQVRLRASAGLEGVPDLLPAASFGELGAAMGPASIILATLGPPPEERGGRCLVWLSGDDGSYAALLVN